MDQAKSSNFHIVMFPWFAVGHMTPFLHLSNKLAEKGHTITFLLPKKTQNQLQHFNLYPDLITFHPLTIPHVEGLPIGAETASDVPISLTHLLIIALDRTRDQVEAVIKATRPKIVFNDSAHWLSQITRPLGIKTMHYSVVCAAALAIAVVPARSFDKDKPPTEAELAVPPKGYPSSTVVLHRHEARGLSFIAMPYGEGINFFERITTCMSESDALAIRTCRELEGELCDYIASQYNKQLLLTGPVLPEQAKTALEERWAKWLGQFPPRSVVFCAFGSQHILEKDQFQELLLGFELTGLPFFIALKPPTGASTVEEAFPDGFEERIKGRGVVWGGWVQQVLILDHPSVGCFVNHCGFGSLWESLMNNCQIVLVPHLADQILNTRLMAGDLKVAVEVEREENGWFSKESLCKAIKSVMDKDSEVGTMIQKNHSKSKETLVNPGFLSGYIDKFVQDLQELVI
ncbi:hypothetical protein ACOSP7_030921 [Xanthoceras sorbifolium]|uniref:Glycosyltransferase n=1 Tax=Xanthoceras sorbifolium TaxID=99658 RepID=A0ABQ8H1K0_9ROSI|nr:hypothetical protein JRO89_XS15G0103100 [Xanthoceras sorbifolium]KAH7544091.1 hypothetical protein JRO89_XS15G0103400 [Xanthoceras sorbifolium]KAH7544092.1 hypothetical protein JRO89_XS15G0103700 [Xanthoceras sorbifolium]